MALAYGTAKDRKKALKCMKVGFVQGEGRRGRGELYQALLGPARCSSARWDRPLSCGPPPRAPQACKRAASSCSACPAPQGHVGAMARDEWGHLTLITALSVVDDTTLLRKSVVAELQVGRG